jgi:hypothetical protein
LEDVVVTLWLFVKLFNDFGQLFLKPSLLSLSSFLLWLLSSSIILLWKFVGALNTNSNIQYSKIRNGTAIIKAIIIDTITVNQLKDSL